MQAVLHSDAIAKLNRVDISISFKSRHQIPAKISDYVYKILVRTFLFQTVKTRSTIAAYTEHHRTFYSSYGVETMRA